MNATVKIVVYVLAGVLVLLALGWLGLQVQPASFPAFVQSTPKLETSLLPSSLPAPVERFYKKIYGDRIPIIHSAVLTGRATIQPIPGGPRFPARFRFIHITVHDYRHYIEATWFGLPIMRVNESYLDGTSRQEMPWGTVDNSLQANQAANQGMWAETMSMPGVFLTDPRVGWEAVDDLTAILVVPFGTAFERFVVRFDPDSGLVRLMEVMRYRDANQKAQKILWITESLPEKTVDAAGVKLPAVGCATWLDVGNPWAYFSNEQIVCNVDVNEYLRNKGH